VLYEDRQPVKKKRREELSAHSARRTFISILIENGVEPIQVMHLVGHTRLSTLQIYIDMYGPKSKNRLSALEF
jgi:site-specific recombinase XerD